MAVHSENCKKRASQLRGLSKQFFEGKHSNQNHLCGLNKRLINVSFLQL